MQQFMKNSRRLLSALLVLALLLTTVLPVYAAQPEDLAAPVAEQTPEEQSEAADVPQEDAAQEPAAIEETEQPEQEGEIGILADIDIADASALKGLLTGSGTQAEPYLITSESDLKMLATVANNHYTAASGANFVGVYFKQTTDITLTGSWTSIGYTTGYYFGGNYDGDGHYVDLGSNAVSGAYTAALFGCVTAGEIRNVHVKGTIDNAYSAGAASTAGVVAYASGSTQIVGCVNEANVTGKAFVGGVVAQLGKEASVSGCVNYGAITQGVGTYNSSAIGGVVGKATGTGEILNCTNHGAVSYGSIASSTTGVGGVVGTLSGGSVVRACGNDGAVGLSETTAASTYVGGVVGYVLTTACHLESCYNAGAITGASGSVGGVVGYISRAGSAVTNCMNLGSVTTSGATSSYNAGGIVGATNAYAVTFTACYNAGTVQTASAESGAYCGAITGKSYSSYKTAEYYVNCYYLAGTAAAGVYYPTTKEDPVASFDTQQSAWLDQLLVNLGNGYIKDRSSLYSSTGYPILPWMDPNATYEAIFAITDGHTQAAILADDCTITITDSNGQPADRTALANGSYTYSVAKADYETASGSFTVEKGNAAISVTLNPTPYSYSFTVTPFEQNTVFQLTNADPAVGTVEPVSAENGVYTFNLYRCYGDYTWSAKCYGYTTQSGTIAASAVAAGSQSIQLATSGSYEVKLSITDGKQAIDDADISVESADYGTAMTPTAYGVYSLVSGDYNYTVRRAGFATVKGSFRVLTSAVSLTITMELPKPWDGTETDETWYSSQGGDKARVYYISAPAELAAFRDTVNSGVSFANKTVYLTADIDLNNKAWTPIADEKTSTTPSTSNAFCGVFDGQGHSIQGIYVHDTKSFNRALFGSLYHAEIRDLSAVVDIQAAKQYTGGIAGQADSTLFENVKVSGKIVNLDGNYVGGLIGSGVTQTRMTACVNEVNINPDFNLETGTSKTRSYFGGLAGRAEAPDIQDCVNRGRIAGGYAVGGLVGTTGKANGSIARSLNYGEVVAFCNGTTASYSAGGIVGYVYKADTIDSCANYGAVNARCMSVGGIAGYFYTKGAVIQNCYNAGSVTNSLSASQSYYRTGTGGIAGNNASSSSGAQISIVNCYNRGTVSHADPGSFDCVGAIMGKASSLTTAGMSQCFYLAGSAGQALGYDGSGTVEGTSFEKAADYSSLIAQLGESYCADTAQPINDGFPILAWQNPDAMFRVSFDLKLDTNANDGGETVITVKNAEGEEQTAGENGDYTLPTGEYTYKVSKQGYFSLDDTDEGSFTVRRSAVTVTVNLKARTYTYVFRVTSGVTFQLKNDRTANVETPSVSQQDGMDVYTYLLHNGTYSYNATRFGWVEDVMTRGVTGQIEVSFANGEKTIRMRLDQENLAPLTVDVKTADNADVTPSIVITAKDGDYAGQDVYSGEALREVKFPAGTYTYTVKAAGYDKATGEFTLKPAEAQTVTVTLQTKSWWDGESVDATWYNPDATEYFLYTEEELAGLARLVNNGIKFSGKVVHLMADMNLGNNAWTPIGGYATQATHYFAGVFDGGGHSVTIRNGVYNANETGFGLFGMIRGTASNRAAVKDLVLFGNVTAQSATYTYFGGLAGYATYTNFTNVSNRMNLTVSVKTSQMGFIDLGGLVGWSVFNTFNCCSNTGSITGIMDAGELRSVCYVGGITGLSTSATSDSLAYKLDSCYNTGTISATGGTVTYAGGITGNAGTGNRYGSMVNCYSSGVISTGLPLVGYGGYEGPISGNNYYLDTTLGEGMLSTGTAKTDAELRDLAEALGENYKPSSTYPVLYWEAAPESIELSVAPNKTAYLDREDFDGTGMKLLVKYSEDDAGTVIESGWQVLDGKCLKPTQTTVTVSYMGKTCAVPITVQQVTHDIPASDLVLSVAAPAAGELPQTELSLTESQQQTLSEVSLQWYADGKPMAEGDRFQDGVYYRTVVTLKSHYVDDDVWYVFSNRSRIQVENAYETLYTARTDGGRTLSCTLTWKLSDTLTDTASHRYYQGDTRVSADYAQYLSDTLTIQSGDAQRVFTVEELEKLAVEQGLEAVYSCQGLNRRVNYTMTGLPLYVLLKTAIPAVGQASDESIVTIGGVDFTLGELRVPGNSYGSDGSLLRSKLPYLLAYGVNARPNTAARGPLCLAAPAGTAASDNEAKFVNNVSSIYVNLVTASSYQVTFQATDAAGNAVDGTTLRVEDQYGNAVYTGALDTVTLKAGETFTYTITAPGYGEKTGEVSQACTVTVQLLPIWDGEYTEPKTDESGAYLIYTVSELMWYNKQATQISNDRSYEMMAKDVILMADLDMAGTEGKWLPMGCLDYTNTLYLYVVNPSLPKYYGGGAYTGTFDGNGHTIYNLHLDWENYYKLELAWDGSVLAYAYRISYIGGLFGQTRGATIRDLGLEGSINLTDRPDSIYADWCQFGGLVGFAQAGTTITGCYTDVDMKYIIPQGEGTLGGYANSGYPENCDLYMGGLVGSLTYPSGGTNRIENCYTAGDLYGEGTRSIRAGGIAGATRNGVNYITKCYASGSINVAPSYFAEADFVPTYVGGIIGGVNVMTGASEYATNVSYCFALNPTLNIEARDGFDFNYTHANRVVGREDFDESDGTLQYNQGLYGMVINGAVYTQDENDQSYRSASGRSIQMERAQTGRVYENVKWNEGALIWRFDERSYPVFTWQPSPVSVTPARCDGGDSCPSKPYTDVDTSRWYHESIDYVIENGLFIGLSNTTFGPDKQMSRAMFVTVLSRMEAARGGTTTGFSQSYSDVGSGMWYSEPIAWATEAGIVRGVGNNRFAPNSPLTREQIATILYNYARYLGLDVSVSGEPLRYADADSISGWARNAMTWAYERGIITGKTHNLVDPQGIATRAEVAAVICRAAGLLNG